MPSKRIYLNFFDMACVGSHMSPGQWRDPDDKGHTKDTLEYWVERAKLAEKGKISFIFLADTYSGHEVYKGSTDTIIKSGTQFPALDPMVLISAMAAATKSVGFGVTGSISYENPYALARRLSSLDHITRGRIAWNVVTSWSLSTAKALGVDSVMPHDERYAMADEYMDLTYKLWESSWEDGAIVRDTEKRMFADPAKVHRVVHDGKYFKCDARFQTHPSPQRTPVIFQAGTSKAGRSFATKHAEAIYIGGLVPSQSAALVKDIREAAVAAGRDPQSIKFFVGISPIVGRTEEEAKAKYERAKEYSDAEGGLAQFSGYTGIDLSKFPLDEEFELTDSPGDAAVHSFIDNFNKTTGSDEKWTPRKLGETMCLGGFHPAPVGTAAQVADVFESWINEAGVDGFNIAAVQNPSSLNDIVDLLVPELVKRGLMWEDYEVPGGTMRENLNGKGESRLRKDHYGRKFAFGS